MKIKKSKGFTLIELMSVVVIIGILIAISIPNFFTAHYKARVSEVKSNMHIFQVMAETYSIDWGASYPLTGLDLKTAAQQKKYWRNVKNPFTHIIDDGTSPITSVNSLGEITPADFKKGNIGYLSNNGLSYTIYGAGDKDGLSILNGQRVFSLTNN